MTDQTLDGLIAETEMRLAKMKALKDIVEDKELAGIARRMLQQSLSTVAVTEKPVIAILPGKSDTRSTKAGIDRILVYFKATGNQPATIEEIADGAGITTGNTRRILYMANPGEFERFAKSRGDRKTRFRLKQAAQRQLLPDSQ